MTMTAVIGGCAARRDLESIFTNANLEARAEENMREGGEENRVCFVLAHLRLDF